jgi:hypothetical protein
MDINGFEDGSNIYIDHMLEFKGFLYASTINCPNNDCTQSNGGELWRSPDGYTWQQVVTDGFGDRNRNAEIFHLFILGSQLCASTWPNSGDAQIWCSDNGEMGTWNHITDPVLAGNQAFPSAQLFNNVMFISSINSGGGKLYRKAILAGASPAVWTETPTPYALTFEPNKYISVESMAVYNKAMYVAFSYSQATPDAKSASIWRCTKCDGTDWSPEGVDVFNNNNSNRSVSLVSLKTGIYAIFANNNDGIQVWYTNSSLALKYPTVGHWRPLSLSGLGSSNNKLINHTNSTAVVNGTLYLGVLNFTNGSGVWKFCPTAAVCK